ncbi:HvfC/BufC family peptide modification chaperone [Acidithiobacillus sulfuriphilus]|uniref:HvfC/BufC family peptide modification chaperone n=1 Tax=Acidithiobacillus sulfuriphilus TaxID=1867749 RepID=UPI003F63A908
MLRQWQSQWIARLQKVEPLVGVLSKDSSTAQHQSFFRIYQNNIQQRLTESLAFIYPALLTAMGDVPFAELVSAFSAVDLPIDPDLMRYGEHLASFLTLPGGVHHGRTPHDFAGLARLEWFIHASAFVYEHPSDLYESGAPIPLGNLSGKTLYLDQQPPLLRTTKPIVMSVILHHDVELKSLDENTNDALTIFGFCALNHPEGLRFLALSAGEYAFLRLLTQIGNSLEDALLWGLYSQPDGRFNRILQSFQNAGILSIRPTE